MQKRNRIKVNLNKPPSERWEFLKDYIPEMNQLLGCYLSDMTGAGIFSEAIDLYKANFISEDYLEEIQSIDKLSNFSENEVLITNLYYDALKFIFGCTSYAIHINNKNVHARNLDWWTENELLKVHTKVFDFQKNGKTIFSCVSWPGFIGALSGVRKGAFSITLNAVSSNDSPEFAIPITFLIRDVLEKVNEFDKAVKILSETPIASDCLLMVIGVEENQSVVIERTPTRFELREPENGIITVTNEYLKIDNKMTNDSLQETASCRYRRVLELYKENEPKSSSDCFRILSDDRVKMNITMQQMLLYPATGEIELKK